MSEFGKAKYQSITALSPYITRDRYERPKEVFKAALLKLESVADINKKLSVGDLGCANGEFLYYLKKKYPQWQLSGYDFEKKFIDTAKSFPGLDGVRFETKDLFDIRETFDVVSCFGSVPIFVEIEKLLTQLLALCKEGGVIIADGLFNAYEVDVRTIYCDNSKPECRGVWQQDFTQHSRSRIQAFLQNRVKNVEFEAIAMGVEIPRNPNAPHSNVFTFRDANGRNIITSGLNLILNSTLMTIRK